MSPRSKAGARESIAVWEALALALLAVAAGFASVMHLYPRNSFPSYDATSYIFVADGILKGRIPYLQLWENKGLPLYALNVVGRMMTPGHYDGIWWLELAFISLAFWGVLWTLRQFASRVATLLAAGLLGFGIVITAVGGNVPEFWNLPLQASGLLAAWLLVSGEWRSRRWLMVLTGLAAGFAGMMKINLLGTWVALFGLLVALTVARRVAVKDAAKVLGLMAAGFCIPAVASMVPILAWGATGAWWDQWIRFGVNMTREGALGSRGSSVEAMRVGLTRIAFISATVLAGLVAAPIGWLARKRPRVASERVWMAGFLLCWLGIELWASTVNGQTYVHYSLPWLIPAVALIGLLFGGDTIRWPGLAFAVVVVAFGLWYAAPSFNYWVDATRGFPPVIRHENPSRHAAQERMVREVRLRTRPSDTIFIWGMDPIVFAETGRLSAGPYAHPLDILLAPGYQSEEQFAALMSELQANPPKLIIDSSRLKPDRPSIQELRVSSPTDTAAGRVQPYMRSLPEFIGSRYRHVATAKPRVDYYELIGD